MERECTRCKETKTLDNFYPLKLGKYGRSSTCKPCQIIKVKEWCDKNPGRKKLNRKNWYHKNKESEKAKIKKWRHDNAAYLKEHHSAYVKRNHVRYAKYRWLRVLREQYGMTEQNYEEMYRYQNGVCAICSKPNLNGTKLHVDHDHATNKVRSLLCQHCNMVLGHSKESVDVLLSAADYIRKPAVVQGGVQ